MIGRTPGNIVALRPMKDGVIADFETTATMMKHYIRQAQKGKGLFSRQSICDGLCSIRNYRCRGKSSNRCD